MNKVLSIILIALISIFYSCKVKEKAEKVKKDKLESRSSKYLLEQLEANEFKFKTISSKATISFTENGKTSSFKTNIRVVKDSAIWVSITPLLGIEMARVLITKDSVKLIDRINNKYFIGTIEYINDQFDTDIDYDMLESLIIGNSVAFENDDKIRSAIDKEKHAYIISTVKKRKLKKALDKNKGKKLRRLDQIQTIWLDPNNFKITALLIKDIETDHSLKVEFHSFMPTENNQLFPSETKYLIEAESTKEITINYSKLTFDKTLNLSFNIPSKYEKIK
ncbi:MAG: hypothetical protein Kow0079_02710 [Vicingaceae bacterium]